MSASLSPVFLSFADPETRQNYEREKKIHYSKLMPVIALVTL